MKKSPTSQHVDIAQRGDTALQATRWLALVSGVALIIDTVMIAIINGPFDPLDSILLFLGLVTMLLTLVALAMHVSRRRAGYERIGFAIITFLVSIAILGAISFAFDAAGRTVFPSANVGLHDEWSFFSVGLCLLGIALWATLRLTHAAHTTHTDAESGPALL